MLTSASKSCSFKTFGQFRFQSAQPFQVYLREKSCFFPHKSCCLSEAKPRQGFPQLAWIVLKLCSEQLEPVTASHLRIQGTDEGYIFHVFISILPLLTAYSVWGLTLVDDGVSGPTNDVISGTEVIFNLWKSYPERLILLSLKGLYSRVPYKSENTVGRYCILSLIHFSFFALKTL